MRLVPVEDYQGEAALLCLWHLLSQRTPEQNISHTSMPDWHEHVAFVRNHPYEAWYIIEHEEKPIGMIYLSKPPAAKSLPGNEIGIDIFDGFKRKGFGTAAVNLLREKHGERRYLANVAPNNEASRAFWEKMGFRLVQVSYVSA